MLGFSGTARPGSLRSAWLIFQMTIKALSLVTCSSRPVQNMASRTVGSLLPVFTMATPPLLTQAHSLGSSQFYVCFVVLDFIIVLFVFWACVPSPKLYLLLLRWPGACDPAAPLIQGCWWEQLVSSCKLLTQVGNDAQLQPYSLWWCCASF